jgi:hypothetical protein
MPPPHDVNLGPLTRTVLDGAVWREESLYPATQVWADEAERIFAFLETQRVFPQFLTRLRSGHGRLFAERRKAPDILTQKVDVDLRIEDVGWYRLIPNVPDPKPGGDTGPPNSAIR